MSVQSDRSAMTEKFNQKLRNILADKRYNSAFISRDKYKTLVRQVKEAKLKTKNKDSVDYRRVKRYDVLTIGDVDNLIVPLPLGSTNIQYFVRNEDLFEILHETHINLGHGGRNKMLNEIKKNYKNVSQEAIMLYLSICEQCKSKAPKKLLMTRPKVFSEMDSRGQVDILDMQGQPDGDFSFILVYQDQHTKFVHIRALKSKQADEIALTLLEIFTIFGAPNILQSVNGREFTSEIIDKLYSMWPEVRMVHGKPNSTPYAVEQTNLVAIQRDLTKWLQSNSTKQWSLGLKFVQMNQNQTVNKGLKRTPFEAMFKCKVKFGLSRSSIPLEIIDKLKTEEELDEVLKVQGNSVDKLPVVKAPFVQKHNHEADEACKINTIEASEQVDYESSACLMYNKESSNQSTHHDPVRIKEVWEYQPGPSW